MIILRMMLEMHLIELGSKINSNNANDTAIEIFKVARALNKLNDN